MQSATSRSEHNNYTKRVMKCHSRTHIKASKSPSRWEPLYMLNRAKCLCEDSLGKKAAQAEPKWCDGALEIAVFTMQGKVISTDVGTVGNQHTYVCTHTHTQAHTHTQTHVDTWATHGLMKVDKGTHLCRVQPSCSVREKPRRLSKIQNTSLSQRIL